MVPETFPSQMYDHEVLVEEKNNLFLSESNHFPLPIVSKFQSLNTMVLQRQHNHENNNIRRIIDASRDPTRESNAANSNHGQDMRATQVLFSQSVNTVLYPLQKSELLRKMWRMVWNKTTRLHGGTKASYDGRPLLQGCIVAQSE